MEAAGIGILLDHMIRIRGYPMTFDVSQMKHDKHINIIYIFVCLSNSFLNILLVDSNINVNFFCILIRFISLLRVNLSQVMFKSLCWKNMHGYIYT